MTTQLITPNPDIPCKPGWCLEYVNNAFSVPTADGSDRVPAIRASATDAWYGSTSQHQDRNFPAGVWHPVWYGLANEPLGHVVLRAPDGSVYSASDLGNTPHHHPDLTDLEAYYAYYGMTLTYRGWTEDVEGTPVIALDGTISYEGTITPVQEDDDMASVPQDQWDELLALVKEIAAKPEPLVVFKRPSSPTCYIGQGMEYREIKSLDTLYGIQWAARNGWLSVKKNGQVQIFDDIYILGIDAYAKVK